jgi:CheY-like chemotaxis protein
VRTAHPRRAVSHTVVGPEACEHPRVPTTVLIVDDHPSFRAIARAVLAHGGYAVVGEAADARSALAAARQFRPDCVLLDVQLGEVDVLVDRTWIRPFAVAALLRAGLRSIPSRRSAVQRFANGQERPLSATPDRRGSFAWHRLGRFLFVEPHRCVAASACIAGMSSGVGSSFQLSANAIVSPWGWRRAT